MDVKAEKGKMLSVAILEHIDHKNVHAPYVFLVFVLTTKAQQKIL